MANGVLRPHVEVIGAATGVNRALMAQYSRVLEAPRAVLEAELRPQLEASPAIVLEERDYSWGGPPEPVEEEDEDWEEFIDSIAEEQMLEDGEGRATTAVLPEEQEDFFQYAWRKLELDFGALGGDPVKQTIAGLLTKWQRNEWRPSPSNLSVTHPDARSWFGQLAQELPDLQDLSSSPLPTGPDITFYLRGTELHYEVNRGLLGRCRVDPAIALAAQDRLQIDGCLPFAPNLLPRFISYRKAGLTFLAEFLRLNQALALQAADLTTAISRLRSLEQKVFIKFLHRWITDRKDLRDLASRIISDKLVQLPCDQLVRAEIFFDRFLARVYVLKDAIEICKLNKQYPTLLAADHEIILDALCSGEANNEATIRHTIWPKLQLFYSEREWEELGIKGKAGRKSIEQRISDQGLAEVINAVNRKLDRVDKAFAEEDIRKLRDQVKTKPKRKKAKTEELVQELPDRGTASDEEMD